MVGSVAAAVNRSRLLQSDYIFINAPIMNVILVVPQLFSKLLVDAGDSGQYLYESPNAKIASSSTTTNRSSERWSLADDEEAADVWWTLSAATAMSATLSAGGLMGNETVGGGGGDGNGSDDEFSPVRRTPGEQAVGTLTFIVIMLMTIGGNTLVILSVLTYRPLNKVQNYFLVSLAVADLAVAVLVTPFHVAKFLVGEWIFGLAFCQMWLTCDILCCTASILNLCAIALDRYWAIHDPIEYASKRTLRLVLTMIAVVWSLSLLISVPPLIGWNDWSKERLKRTCELTTQREFVVYSASGSFFIPLMVMTTVYAKIYLAARQRLRNKRRSVRGLSTNSCPDPETSRRAKPWRQRGSKLVNGTQAAVVAVANTAVTPSMPPLPVQADDRSHQLLSRQTSGNGGSSSGGNANELVTTPLAGGALDGGQQPSPATPAADLTSEKVLLLKGQNGEDCSRPVPGSAAGIGPALRPLTSSATAASGASLRSRCLRRLLPPERSRSVTSTGDPSSRNASVRGFPTRDDSLRVSCHVTVQKFIKDRERISVTKEKKAAKTLAVIMGVFVLCWLPFFVMYVVKPFVAAEDWLLHSKIEEAITWLGYINSAINPVIYTIFNMDFRRAFIKYLCPFRTISGGDRG